MIRHTKIVATIGPASWAPETLRRLVEAGVDVVRLNFSHGTPERHATVLARVRAASKRAGRPVGVLLDLPGPKFRVGDLPEGGVLLGMGDIVTLDSRARTYQESRIPLRAPGMCVGVARGERLLLDDGHMSLEILSEKDGAIRARVLRGGRLTSHKGVNLPGSIRLRSSLTEADKRGLAFAVEHGVDLVALSFVRSADDVRRARKRLAALGGANIPVIPKLEKPQAIEMLPEILNESPAGVMVARGDLGVELPYERVPLIQKDVIDAAHYKRIPVIVATQMLQSMTEQIQPTRAEVSDVAGAVFDGADAVMLSAETASGAHPVESVAAMDRILRAAEARTASQPPELPRADRAWTVGRQARAITATAAALAERMGAAAIVVLTATGASARLISTTRPKIPILAFSTDDAVVRQITLLYGVRAGLSPLFERVADATRFLNRRLVREKWCKRGDPIVLVYGTPFGVPASTNTLKIHRVGDG